MWESGIMSYSAYKQSVVRKRIEVIQRGGRNCPAVVNYSTLPFAIRKAVDGKMRVLSGRDGASDAERPSLFEGMIQPDAAARAFYTEYRVEGERMLPSENITEYYTNAIVLNAMREMLTLRKGQRHACGLTGDKRSGLFKSVFDEVCALDRSKYPHTLPSSERRLRDRYNSYFKKGEKDYASLIHSNFCNQNSRKVSEEIDRLIISLYCQSYNPYADWVQAQYLQFLAGTIEVVDTRTGAMFDRREFCNENGDPITLSEGTVRNIINAPKNKVLIESIRYSYHKFGALSRPHLHRSNAKYALSKVSLDDRDLPRKLHDGSRVKAYYAYDVCSGVLLGASYSRKKDTDLFVGCLRDMFRFLDMKALGLPLEMEVENHLVRQFEDDLMKAGVVFPFIHWCAPTNSQEKHAEHFNKQKKYGYEKRYQDGIGRFYLKNPTNQTEGERYYDEEANEYRYKTKTYDYDRLVADDRESIIAYNNGLHRDQKRYPGKTRMQVFMENLNPNLTAINRALLLRHIGNSTTTSIQRNQYIQVQYADYQLGGIEVLQRLKPNNYKVTAYWLPNENGEVGEVYMYQNDVFVGTATKIVPFTTAHAEWTEADTAAMIEQQKYVSHFDKRIREEKQALPKVKVLEVRDYSDIEVATVESVAEIRKEDDIDALCAKFSAETYKEHAIAAL